MDPSAQDLRRYADRTKWRIEVLDVVWLVDRRAGRPRRRGLARVRARLPRLDGRPDDYLVTLLTDGLDWSLTQQLGRPLFPLTAGDTFPVLYLEVDPVRRTAADEAAPAAR